MTKALERIHITGFTSLADVTLAPGRLTVLIGANGSGKSNLLRALRMAPLMRTGSLQRFVGQAGGASALLHYGAKRTQACSIELDFTQGERGNRYCAGLGFAAGDRLLYLDESVGYRPSADAEMQSDSIGAGHWESGQKRRDDEDGELLAVPDQLLPLPRHVDDVGAAHPRPRRGRPLSPVDGSNLAAYLSRLERSSVEAEQKA
jgi:predicted ATPase